VREKCENRDGMIFVLEQLASYGYDGVEFFNYSGIEANEMKELLHKNNLQAVNSHVSLDRWRSNDIGEIRYAQEAGIPALTIPYIVPEQRKIEDYRRLIEELPSWVSAAKQKGIQICYHNHDFEFVLLDGKPVLDVLLQCDGLEFELDTFWSWFAGVDNELYMRKYQGRLPFIHIKDFIDKNKTPPVFCSIGEGKMDNRRIVELAAQYGAEWVVVEQDNSLIDPMESARLSIQTMKGWGL
jgi:sugar phosphate isomerase/epimerase